MKFWLSFYGFFCPQIDAKISEKLRYQKPTKNTVLSAHLGAERFTKNKSKFHQKSLTQAC